MASCVSSKARPGSNWPQESCNISSVRYRNTTTSGESVFFFLLFFLPFLLKLNQLLERGFKNTFIVGTSFSTFWSSRNVNITWNLNLDDSTGSVIWTWLKILRLIFQDRLMMAAGLSGLPGKAWSSPLLGSPTCSGLWNAHQLTAAGGGQKGLAGTGGPTCVSVVPAPTTVHRACRRGRRTRQIQGARKSKESRWQKGS